jgi:hypothetical protein
MEVNVTISAEASSEMGSSSRRTKDPSMEYIKDVIKTFMA